LGIPAAAARVLKIVFNALVRLFVAGFQLYDFSEEVQAKQGRLSALRGENHLLAGLSLDVLADVPSSISSDMRGARG
jgi:hypothetical protein